jgi:hypothetical protein
MTSDILTKRVKIRHFSGETLMGGVAETATIVF